MARGSVRNGEFRLQRPSGLELLLGRGIRPCEDLQQFGLNRLVISDGYGIGGGDENGCASKSNRLAAQDLDDGVMV